MIEKVKEDGEEAALSSSTAPTAGGANGDTSDTAAMERETEDQRRSREDALRQAQKKEVLQEPRAFEFTVELPNVTAVDL